MNERYLFRGKRIDNGEWTQGSYVYSAGNHHIHDTVSRCVGSSDDKKINDNFISVYADKINPATIGQCTGLRDKNGKLIFEGDIISDSKDKSYSTGYIGVVRWRADDDKTYRSCEYRVRLWAKGKVNCYERTLADHEAQRWTIIGNIYDNQELSRG